MSAPESERSALRSRGASNRLYRGEVTNARDGIVTYIQALREERDVQRRLDREFGVSGEVFAATGIGPEDWDKWIADAEDVLRLYDEKVVSVEREFAESLRASCVPLTADSDDTRLIIADAILSGDYSGLAI